VSIFSSPDGSGLVDESITCLDCGERFVRTQGFVGNYCERCRYDSDEIDFEGGDDGSA
jgi:hypothetical protein